MELATDGDLKTVIKNTVKNNGFIEEEMVYILFNFRSGSGSPIFVWR